MTADILIVDDEHDICRLIAGILEDEQYTTRIALNSKQALDALTQRCPSLIFLDIWLQGSQMDGLELLEVIKQRYQDLPVVMISGHGTIETAVKSIKIGAYDYIEKPFKAERLLLVARLTLEASKLKREVTQLREHAAPEARLIGNSIGINQLRQTIRKVAPTNSRVLLSGPAGSGKETVAREIHNQSLRSDGNFIAVNVAMRSREEIEEELFGIENSQGVIRVGALELAHGGTIFIDEVADLPLETQAKLLQVLVRSNFTRLKGSGAVTVDVRVISATYRNLEQEMEDKHFNSDLFHRLAVIPIRVPGLAERREDVPMLIQYFIERISHDYGLTPLKIADDAMAFLQAHDWPGNLRQLRNNIERLLILVRDNPDAPITTDLLPKEIGQMLPSVIHGDNNDENLMSLPLRDAREVFEREYLKAQVNRFGGNISRTSMFVGMERSALHRKLKALGLNST